jgi:hypothetical protein
LLNAYREGRLPLSRPNFFAGVVAGVATKNGKEAKSPEALIRYRIQQLLNPNCMKNLKL